MNPSKFVFIQIPEILGFSSGSPHMTFQAVFVSLNLDFRCNKRSITFLWNILKHVCMFGTMNTIHREHPVTFSGCFKQTFFLMFWRLQKFLMKIWIPSKLSQHNFQLLFRDSIFAWENIVWTREKICLVHYTSYFST